MECMEGNVKFIVLFHVSTDDETAKEPRCLDHYASVLVIKFVTKNDEDEQHVV